MTGIYLSYFTSTTPQLLNSSTTQLLNSLTPQLHSPELAPLSRQLVGRGTFEKQKPPNLKDMKKSIKYLLACCAFCVSNAAIMAQTPETFTPYKTSSLRLPSVPLLVNDPYFSFWSPFDHLTDGTVRHWTDMEKPIDGLLRVDGQNYRWMGNGKSFLLKAIAPMSNAGDSWTGRVSYTKQNNNNWTSRSFNDSSWKEEKAAWGTRGEYPNVNNAWTATNSDIYVRRVVTLTAEDLQKDLWIQFSHDDVFELYVNGTQVISTGETWIQGETHQLTSEEKRKLVVGDNVLAAHCHNTTGGAYIDFGLFENVFETSAGVETATQRSVDVMATSTYYTFDCGPVALDVVFTPVNFISYQVRSTDGQSHDVQFYVATTPQLTVNEPTQPVDASIIEEGGVKYAKAGSTDQPVLKRAGDLITIDWGYLYISGQNGQVSVAPTATMEPTFTQTGHLADYVGEVKGETPCNMTTLAYVHDFGTVSGSAASYMLIGYDEVQDIQYFGKNYKGYWARDGKTIFQAFDDFNARYDELMQRCREQDQTIYDDGLAAGNVKYAELLAASYRQVLAAHKLFQDDGGRLLYFSKENNSNGCVNTVDLTYPSAPLFLLYNTELQKGMMTSIFEYQRTGRWNKDWAAHDLGTYPHANGQVYGGDMPLEESGNMLTLAAMISKIEGNTDWVSTYWSICTRWVNYLVNNGQDPDTQLCTDDFAGHWAHNANLSIKAIMGIAGYAEMCKMRGRDDLYTRYMDIAKRMAQVWEIDARDGDHYKLAFDRGGSWSQKYNLVWDKLWGIQIFPKQVREREMKFYLTKQNLYGLPLDNREKYTKSDWIMWTASMADDTETFLKFSDPLWRWVNETTDRVPLCDWYWTDSRHMRGFRARSVIGGHWMKVLMDKYAPAPDQQAEWAPQGYKIKTRWAADVDPQAPLPEYPRPQMVRSEWQNLNGLWQYAITPASQRNIPTTWDGNILVPFPVESSLSGVMRMLDKNSYLWYQREFTVPESWAGQRVLVNFGAVDYTARVYVNGTFVGTHTGGFGAFSIDITDKLQQGTNTIAVMASDNTDEATQPLGKQRFNPGGPGSIWYTQVSGIWQTVWLEPVSAQYISGVTTTTTATNQLTVNVTTAGEASAEGTQVKAVLKLDGQQVAEATAAVGTPMVLDVTDPKLWSPDAPTLYDLEVSLMAGGQEVDHVDSYAALRTISTRQLANGEWRMQLNGRDLFHFGPLDQGYWPDGLYTAPTDEALLYDVQKTKEWGFNMIRKHEKVEPARWYYHCDRLGLLVWQDMPAVGRSDEGWTPRDWSSNNGSQPSAVANAFKAQWKEVIEQHISNPCIVVWTPFNESWGQFRTAEIVDYTRSIDPTRLINPASGGNHYQGVGDIIDLHDYDRPPHIYLHDGQRPVVLGEYGGLGRHISDHRWYENAATTYVNYGNEKELTDAYVATAEAVLAMAKDAQATDGKPAAFCAAVYTQTTDVETEVNGLMTYDRAVIKVDEARISELNSRLSHVYGDGTDAIREHSYLPPSSASLIYTISGMQVDSLVQGVNILRREDGTICKVFCKK